MKKDTEEHLIETVKQFGDLHDDWKHYNEQHPEDRYFLGKTHTFAYVFSKLCEVLEIDEKELKK